jgi:ribosomal protein S18 acetylase RimI-like enzyme
MLVEALINNNPITQIESSGFIHTATKAEENSAVAAAMMAFSTDPAARWLYPDPHQYLTHFPVFIKAFAGKAFERGSAYYAENFAGAALWLPPDVHPDEDALMRLFDATVADRNKEDLFSVFEQMGDYHPNEPHWYLPMIGVDTFHQGRGCGSALMRHALVRCDRDDKLAYLESSNPRNISLYERHGFELLGTIQVGSSPPIFPMLRMPQRDNA